MGNEKKDRRGGFREGAGRPRGAKKNPNLIKIDAERRTIQRAFYVSEIENQKLERCRGDKLLGVYLRKLILKNFEEKFGKGF